MSASNSGPRVLAASLLCGVVFALGLGLSGMMQPAKVVSFLDVTGAWDPSLACVMVGAIGVYLPLYPLVLRRSAPVVSDRFQIPMVTAIDLRLITGSALFGLGWGAAGFCPGPAIASLSAATGPVLIFVVAMAAGMLGVTALDARKAG